MWLISSLESYPTVEQRRTPFAAAAGFDAHCESCSFDNVTQSDFLFSNETGQVHVEPLPLLRAVWVSFARGHSKFWSTGGVIGS